MTAIKRHHDGAWVIADIIKGHLVTRVYIGYTKREAMKNYRRDTTCETRTSTAHGSSGSADANWRRSNELRHS